MDTEEYKNLFDIAINANMRLKGSTHTEEWMELVEVCVAGFIERDMGLRDSNSLEREIEIFTRMSSLIDFASEKYAFADYIFSSWLFATPNPFAKAYLLGTKHAIKRNGIFASRRAANGRRLIGETTRNRVRAEAEKRMHLTKGAAAYEIGSAINLSPDRVRKLLSEIFPGDSWVTSLDLTRHNAQSG